MDMLVPDNVKQIMQTLIDNGHEAYIVGGAVRDHVIGQEPKDYDVFTNASGKDLVKIFPQGKVVGNELRQERVYTIILDDVEVSRYRQDPAREEFGTDLEQHLSTCDFTCNAMYCDISGNIFDPLDGYNAIKCRILYFVGNPEDRLKEDPIRALRALRFTFRYGWMFPGMHHIFNCITDTMNYGRARVPYERIKNELLLILQQPHLNTELLLMSGILQSILPMFADTLNLSDHGKHHEESVYTHTRLAGEYIVKITSNPLLRLAAILHDIGKSAAAFQDDGITKFHHHDSLGANYLLSILPELTFSGQETDYIVSLVQNHMFGYDASIKAIRQLRIRLDRAGVNPYDLFALMWADNQGKTNNKRVQFVDFLTSSKLVETYLHSFEKGLPFKVRDLKISGNDIMNLGLKEGPVIGKILNTLFEEVVSCELDNEPIRLLVRAKELVNSIL